MPPIGVLFYMFDFPEKVTAIDSIPTEFKNFYQEDGDSFVLNPAIKAINDEKVRTLKALENERKVSKNEKSKLSEWETLGLSPQEIKDLAAEKERQKTQKAIEEGNFESLKKQMLEQHEKEKKTLLDAKDTMFSAVKKHLVSATATAEIAAANGVPQLLMPHIESKVTVLNEDGKFEVRILDAKGEPRVNAKGEYTTIKDLVQELREDPIYSQAFKGTGHSGSGTSGGTGTPPASQNKVKQYKDMTIEDKSAYIKEHGLDGWNKFLAENKKT